ncbi:MAG: hypothetical protein MRK02_17280 [Candidatus Scalindua sp.]|nr:hypothetical protein [Candidatus Scalindua sp.]
MKIHSNVYTILIVFLFLIQQIISGCSTTVTKGLQKEDLRKIETDLVSQNLFKNKCSLCHELPDIDGFSSEEWTAIIDYTHDTKAARKFITLEEAEKIKTYLKSMS